MAGVECRKAVVVEQGLSLDLGAHEASRPKTRQSLQDPLIRVCSGHEYPTLICNEMASQC
jgi:hypothetical protein